MKKRIFFAIFSILFSMFSFLRAESSVSVLNDKVIVYCDEVQEPFKILFLSDSHVSPEEKLPSPYDDYSKRMFKFGARSYDNLKTALLKAQDKSYSFAVLCGDIFNYPSPASIDGLMNVMDSVKIPTYYLAGNHDWHYEGDSGTDEQQRERWIESSLKKLYRGENPMCYSKTLKGIKFLFIDNSTYEISQTQLDFIKKEIDEGKPVVIFAHIPFYTHGALRMFTCGSPDWNAKNDPGWKIERRMKWKESGASKTTLDTIDLIFSSPNVLGVFAGHIHRKSVDSYKGKFQIVSDAFRHSQFMWSIEFEKFR